MDNRPASTRLFRNPVIAALLAAGLLCTQSALAELVIIVNPANKAEITAASVRNIFLGKDTNFSNSQKAVPVELADGPVRKQFLKTYLHKTETNLQHHWSIKTFTGKGQAPQKFATEEELKKAVASHPEMIGFIDSAKVDDSVKALQPK